MDGPALTIQTAVNGLRLFDASNLTSLVFSHNLHGPEAMRAIVPMTVNNMTRLMDRIGTPHAVVAVNGGVLWAGRVEDVGVTDAGLSVTAYGYWRALSDVPYTALWSDTRMANWQVVTSAMSSGRSPERYSISTESQIYFALTKGTVYGINDNAAEVRYPAPSGGGRDITQVTFVYSTNLPTGWTLALSRWVGGAAIANVWSLAGDGTVQTASVSQTLTGSDEVRFIAINTGGSAYTMSGETGSIYVGIGVIRVKTTTASTVSGDLIAADIVANTSGLSPDTSQIQNPGVDLRDLIYEDASAADVLTELASFGDTNVEPYEVSINNDRVLCFCPRGELAREWYINVTSLDLERSLAGFYSSAYAVYRDVNGRVVRTATETDTQAAAKYGARRGAVQIQTTDATQAELYRDVFLADSSQFTPRAQIQINQVFARGNTPAPPWIVKAGDYVNLRNLPIAPSEASLNKIRRFRASRTEYDAMTGVLTIEPEAPLSTLDFLIARNSIGIKAER